MTRLTGALVALAVTTTPILGCDSNTSVEDLPAAVTDLAAVEITPTSVTLQWTQVDDGLGAAADYALAYGSPTLTEDWALGTGTLVEGTAIGESLTHVFSDLVEETAYEFQLVAYRGASVADAVAGPLSNVASATTRAALASGTATADGGDAEVVLTATAPSGGNPPYTYQWYRSTTSGFTPGDGNALPAFTSLSETDTDVTNGTTYYYVMAATDDLGSSVTYAEVSATPVAPLVAGTATATPGDGQVSLSATEPSGGIAPYAYQWHRSTTSGFTPGSSNALTGFTSLSETDSDVTNGTTYYYVLTATDADGNSVAYAEADATPDATVLSHPNQPAGFEVVTERSFDELTENSWSLFEADATMTIETDATAPASPANVGATLFPASFDGTGSLRPIVASFSGWSKPEVYVHYWFKVSDNWQGHSSGVNKVIYLTDSSSGNAGDPLFFLVRGVGSGTLTFEVMHQNPDVSPVQYRYRYDVAENEISASTADAEIVRGQWHDLEVLIRPNTPGAADGEIHAWVDGTKIIQYTSAEFMSSDTDGTLDNIRWEPIWGGSGGTVAEDMYQFMDHFYVSGAP